MKANILGVEYKIVFSLLADDRCLKTCDGYCDNYKKEIHVRIYTDEEKQDDRMTKDLDVYNKEVLRHEIVHAFLYQSGLHHNSMQYSSAWSENEEMVDWIAVQFPKILKVFQECDCL